MFLKNISKREKILFTVTALIIGIAFFYSIILEPLIKRWKNLNNQIEAKYLLFLKNSSLIERYKEIEDEYMKYPAVLETARSEEEESTKALSEIESVSKTSACRIVNLKPKASKKRGTYKEISFDVTAEGTISEISKFIYEIETSKKMLRIKRFTLTSKTGPAAGMKAIFIISKIVSS